MKTVQHASGGRVFPSRIVGLCGSLVLLVAGGAKAQAPEVDLVKLLTDGQITPQTFSDGVWTLTPPKGRRLFLLPFRVPDRLAGPVSLDDVRTRLSGGQFVAWHIPAVQSNRAAPGPLPSQGEGGPDGPRLSPEPPRLTRDAELRPDGTIHWELSRGLPGGTVKDANKLYALMIDRSLIDPPRERGRATQPRLSPEEQRQKIAERVAILTALREAPDEFSAPAPDTLFAVYYIPESLPRLGFSGDDPLPWGAKYELFEQLRGSVRSTNDPKEWRPLLEQLTGDDHPFGMRMAAAFLAANHNLSRLDENSAMAPLIEKLVTRGGPATRRLLVEAVASSDKPTPVAGPMLDAVMGDADPWVALAAMRARVNDAARRKAVLEAPRLRSFAQTATRLMADPAGPPIAAVLAPVSDLAGQAPEHLEALSNQIKVHTAPEARRAEMIAAVLARARQNDALAARWLDRELLSPADPALASATLRQIIATPLWLGEPKAGVAVSAAQPGAPPQERNRGTARTGRAIAFELLETVPGAQPNEQTLPPAVGPTGVEVAPRSTPTPAAQPRGGFGALLGGLIGGQSTAAPQPSLGDPAGPVQRPATPDVPYPLDSPEHNLLGLLASKDQAIRDLAWAALPRFAIAVAGGAPTSLTQQKVTETYTALADAAASLDPTPVEVVPFLQAQADKNGVSAGMQRLLAGGKGPARITAMLHVASSGAQTLTAALTEMSPDDRVAVAELWYATASASDQEEEAGAPLVVGLLRHSDPAGAGSRVLQWFAQQVSEGRRPTAGGWAQAVGSDDVLIGGLTDPDEGYALGCAAAIIGTVMPPDEAMARQLRQVAGEIAAQAADKEQAKRDVQLRWTELRQTMVEERMRSAAGRYAVTLRVLATPRTPKTDPSKLRPVKHELGEVEMGVGSDGKVTFTPALSVTLSERPLALKLNTPGELGGLPDAQSLNLEDRGELPSIPVELIPDRRGRWSGSALLPDHRSVRVVLTPLR